VVSASIIYFYFSFISFVSYRANKSAETTTTTPSKTPIALTQSLSALRLTHARLLEDHGANKALLRQREAEITALEQRESEAQHTISDLQTKVKGLREKVERGERRSALAEREVGFLQALVVIISGVPLYFFCVQFGFRFHIGELHGRGNIAGSYRC
jgi:peptidoglycan hydrolase CwlO-like protein